MAGAGAADAAATALALQQLQPRNASPNSTNETDAWSELLYRHSPAMTALYCVAYLIVFAVGLVGNCFVVAVVLRSPRMRTVTNYFIVNLALADILVIVFCLPATLMSNIFVPWVLGWWMCKTVPYIQGVSVAASVYSLIAVSMDRFLAIWYPLKCQITKRRARLMIMVIWLVALTTTIPWALFFDLVAVFKEMPDLQICLEVWPPGLDGNLYFLLANLLLCYVIPTILISICYILIWIRVARRNIPTDTKDGQVERMQQRSKFKVVKMLVAVVVLFVLSWMPLYVIFARIKFGGEITPWEEEVLPIATPIAQWLGASNSCINPILYAFFNKKYRRGFVAIIQSRSCCGNLKYDSTFTASYNSNSTRKTLCQSSTRQGAMQESLRKDFRHSSIQRAKDPFSFNQTTLRKDFISRSPPKRQDSATSSLIPRTPPIRQDSASSTTSTVALICNHSGV